MIFSIFKVCTEGRLVLEFTFDDLMRIKTWHMAVRAHREMIPRNVVSMHTHPSQSDPAMLDQLSKNITRQGITNSTLNYLRVSVWSESDSDEWICFSCLQTFCSILLSWREKVCREKFKLKLFEITLFSSSLFMFNSFAWFSNRCKNWCLGTKLTH